MTVSVAIMAHPSRADMVPSVQAALDADASIIWDRMNDRWDTGRRALLAYDPAATHHVVVQDDSIPSRDLVAAVTEAVRYTPPDVPLGLYVGRLRPSYPRMDAMVRHAKRSDSPWLITEGPWWGVGLVVPTAHIAGIVAWGDANPQVANYDRRVTRYFAEQGIDCWYTVPSIIDHRTDHKSLIPGRTGVRHAQEFIGRDESALSIDWSRPPAPAPPRGFLITTVRGPRYACWHCDSVMGSSTRVLKHIEQAHADRLAAAAIRGGADG